MSEPQLEPSLPHLNHQAMLPVLGAMEMALKTLVCTSITSLGGVCSTLGFRGPTFLLYQCHVNLLLKQAFLGFVVFREHWAVVIA